VGVKPQWAGSGNASAGEANSPTIATVNKKETKDYWMAPSHVGHLVYDWKC